MFCSPFVPRPFFLLGALCVACATPAASAEVARISAPRAIVAPRPVQGASSAPRSGAEGTTDADRALGIEWRFHAGSSIHAPPAVAADGTVYLGTGDGYVQAVGPDGALKWSYTVEGAVAWSPIIGTENHVIVATTAQRLYSISPSGLIGWEVRPPVHVATDLLLAPAWGFVFGATDGSLWAYSTHSSALWHATIGGTITGAPAVRGSRTVVGRSDGQLWFLEGASKRFSVALGGRIRESPLFLGDGSVVVLSGDALVRLDSHGRVLFRSEGVEFFGARKGGFFAVETSGALVTMSEDFEVTGRVRLPVTASAAPVDVGPDVACVVAETGRLLFVGPGSALRSVVIATSALHRPVLDAARGRVIVAAGSGTVAAVKIAE